MRKKTKSIPVNTIANNLSENISIERAFLKDSLNSFEDAKQAHREDRHSFFLLESGTVQLEIDFKKFIIKPSSVIYMHPDQVHRIVSYENLTISSLAINNESLNPEYLKLLESLGPAKPIALSKEMFSLISEAISIAIKFSIRKSGKLYHSLLKDSCNMLVALIISQYLELAKPTDKLSRFEIITKAFRELLERNFTTSRRPADYAKRLNISTPYLNECVNNATGSSVSNHIQQRVILEAKRLLYHSDRSVKEIASELGFDDYPYFSRLFTKVTGMTALSFRNKNLG